MGNFTINGKRFEITNNDTLLEISNNAGFNVPSLCYVKGAKHKASCMLCSVIDISNDRIIPACATFPTDGMVIETDSDEIKTIRTLSLELLLSDHRADCEAPCSMVCPFGLDIEKMLRFYDSQSPKEAYIYVSSVFSFPEIPCHTCKAPCEKACRRGSIDKSVEIRKIISSLIGHHTADEKLENSRSSKDRNEEQLFHSRLGRFTDQEKEFLKTTVSTPSRCLHCACAGKTGCKLRHYATQFGIKRPRFDASSANMAMNKKQIIGNLWFEPAKCIRCGLCVYNSDNGFTFKDRGFEMEIIIPEQNYFNVDENIANICPTGALYCEKKMSKIFKI
ncbi:MAG: 2Fe-2S iron-sulfur cluster-binding protein [Marinilabiliaceae bacterium]|nr:2Fe-2S iron-sulfur cluster-binding protein [Marinilabiliaceae bacterium]